MINIQEGYSKDLANMVEKLKKVPNILGMEFAIHNGIVKIISKWYSDVKIEKSSVYVSDDRVESIDNYSQQIVYMSSVDESVFVIWFSDELSNQLTKKDNEELHNDMIMREKAKYDEIFPRGDR